MKNDPIELVNDILSTASKTDTNFSNAASLATVGVDGRPAVRMVLVKQVDHDGFVFFTNLESRKAHDLEVNPAAALCFWWPAFETQVRAEGIVETVGNNEADEYFASRPRGSQIGAWASRQSEILPSRELLKEEANNIARQYENMPVPRPPFWSGYRMRPEVIEIWIGKPDRLHERSLYTRDEGRWSVSMLYP